MKKNFSLDIANKTLTINSAFAEAIEAGEGADYQTYLRLMKDIPGLTVIRKTHATPSKYRSKNGETFKCNQFKNLKYENMETFMWGLPNGEDYMNEYLFLKNYAAEIQTNGYSLIRRWFVAQFPMFRKNPLFYIHNTPTVISSAEVVDQYEAEMEKVA